jgi:hypothetical protein
MEEIVLTFEERLEFLCQCDPCRRVVDRDSDLSLPSPLFIQVNHHTISQALSSRHSSNPSRTIQPPTQRPNKVLNREMLVFTMPLHTTTFLTFSQSIINAVHTVSESVIDYINLPFFSNPVIGGGQIPSDKEQNSMKSESISSMESKNTKACTRFLLYGK